MSVALTNPLRLTSPARVRISNGSGTSPDNVSRQQSMLGSGAKFTVSRLCGPLGPDPIEPVGVPTWPLAQLMETPTLATLP
ncbi:MAG: hypothetical protein IID40_12410 [Planctomycetes bacterium]|nr:hypothetical protein [Planctomycetota bacterium]